MSSQATKAMFGQGVSDIFSDNLKGAKGARHFMNADSKTVAMVIHGQHPSSPKAYKTDKDVAAEWTRFCVRPSVHPWSPIALCFCKGMERDHAAVDVVWEFSNAFCTYYLLFIRTAEIVIMYIILYIYVR